MPVIRRRYHYNKLYMNPEIISGKGMCGQTVPVLSHDGVERNVHFGGFLEISKAVNNRGVMLTHIEAFSSEDGHAGNWCEYGRKEVLLGYEKDDSVFLVLVGGKPFSLGELGGDKPSKVTGTVTRIGALGSGN